MQTRIEQMIKPSRIEWEHQPAMDGNSFVPLARAIDELQRLNHVVREDVSAKSQAIRAVINRVRTGNDDSVVNSAEGILTKFESSVRDAVGAIDGEIQAATGKLRVWQGVVAQDIDLTGAGTGDYVVKGGDSVERIAQAHGLSLAELEEANSGMVSLPLMVGEKLIIPTKEPSSSKNGVAAVGFYIVKLGDTGMKIARANGLTTEELLAANPEVDFRRLHVGQRLNVPAKTPAAPNP